MESIILGSLKFFARNLYAIFSEDILNRFDDDFDILINDNILLLHFFDTLESYESYMMKFFITGNDFSNPSSILQKILLKKTKSLDSLLFYERSLFFDKVFDVSIFFFFNKSFPRLSRKSIMKCLQKTFLPKKN